MNLRELFIGGGAVAIAGAGIAGASLLQMGSMGDYDAGIAATRVALASNPTLPDLIRYATLAANGHNTQPWRFRVDSDGVDILPDLTRRTPVVDPDDHHLFASLGCAVENLSLAAAARGRAGEISFQEDIVRVTLGRERAAMPAVPPISRNAGRSSSAAKASPKRAMWPCCRISRGQRTCQSISTSRNCRQVLAIR